MHDATPPPFPGSAATAAQLVGLAADYRDAAARLRSARSVAGGSVDPPYRLLAVHAIELYLNAALTAAGLSPAEVRAMHHDLGRRAELCCSALVLRRRTEAHLRRISAEREYLTARYDPSREAASELNRLEATLDEISRKVSRLLAG